MCNRVPNLFIAGAPKCGTTALSEYLRGHPDVCFSQPKEPHYFATDFGDEFRVVHSEHAYQTQCFPHATAAHRVIAEGSATYLYSKAALPAIRNRLPDAKIVIMLRNPLQMVQSWHSQLLFGLYEDVHEFRRAWELQNVRRQGRRIPRTCREPQLLQYRDVCLLGRQVQKALTIFPREQIQILLHDDFAADTATGYRSVLAFAGLADDGRTEFPRMNTAKEYRNRAIARMLRFAVRRLRPVWRCTGKAMGIGQVPLFGAPFRLNHRSRARTALPEEVWQELRAAFSEDIGLLSELIGRDLGHWLADSTGPRDQAAGNTAHRTDSFQ